MRPRPRSWWREKRSSRLKIFLPTDWSARTSDQNSWSASRAMDQKMTSGCPNGTWPMPKISLRHTRLGRQTISPAQPAPAEPNELPGPSGAWATCSTTCHEYARQTQGTVSEPRGEVCEPASSQRTSLQHAQPPRCDRHISRARGTPGTSRAQDQLEKSDHFSAKSFSNSLRASLRLSPGPEHTGPGIMT